MKIKRPSRRSVYILAAALLALAGGSVAFALQRDPSVDTVARSVVQACANSGADHSACYEAEVPDLYPKYSVPQIFDIIREIRTLDASYQYCHVLGHKLGERVVAEDPSKWLDDIPLNPSDSLCSNGFIHGVFEARFGADVLDDKTIQEFMPQFQEACEPHDGWQPTDLDRAICYHGMGHLADFITNANLPKALNFCTDVASSEYQRVCSEGVFMQIYQPLEPDDYQLIAQMPVTPTKDTVRQFCAAYSYDPMYEGSCLEESWPFFRDSIFDGAGVSSFCSGQPNATETEQCYVSMASIVGRTSLGQQGKATAACNNFPANEQNTCFSYSAEAVLEEDITNGAAAISLCNSASSPTVTEACLSDLASHANFMFGNRASERSAFCALLPDEGLQQTCEGPPGS